MWKRFIVSVSADARYSGTLKTPTSDRNVQFQRTGRSASPGAGPNPRALPSTRGSPNPRALPSTRGSPNLRALPSTRGSSGLFLSLGSVPTPRPHPQSTFIPLECVQDVKEDYQNVREDSHDVREKSQDVREDSQDVREDSQDVREDSQDAREDSRDVR